MLKKRILIAFIVLLLFSNLFGQGLLSGDVLCLGGNGHVEADPYPFRSHHPIPDLASELDRADDFAVLQPGLEETSRGSCFDIPLSATFSAQHISNGPQSSYEAKTNISRASAGIFNIDSHSSRQMFQPVTAWPDIPALACLQTAILLI